MQKPKVIEHEGVISNITTQKISITILAKSACAHFDAKGSCSQRKQKKNFSKLQTLTKTTKLDKK